MWVRAGEDFGYRERVLFSSVPFPQGMAGGRRLGWGRYVGIHERVFRYDNFLGVRVSHNGLCVTVHRLIDKQKNFSCICQSLRSLVIM